MEDNKKQIDNLNSEIAGYGHSDLKKLHNEKTNLLNDLKNRIYSIQGSLSELQKQGRSLEDDLNHPPFLNCRKSLLSKITEVKVLNMIANDLDEYYSAFDT
ncbi:hypothetical protein RF11_16013 [Thelohanellus kitauei]|uniref:Uncharacterized protein n=1 Tax=Thelohanellus kitauei TaxID=669202 RepID=A0A0C2IMA3_THEKT|nr:hypothetical protein RF11_16013 [Thelohanellus kitauei]